MGGRHISLWDNFIFVIDLFSCTSMSDRQKHKKSTDDGLDTLRTQEKESIEDTMTCPFCKTKDSIDIVRVNVDGKPGFKQCKCNNRYCGVVGPLSYDYGRAVTDFYIPFLKDRADD